MKYDFNRLLTELNLAEIHKQVMVFDDFEFTKLDKMHRIELRIGGKHCRNGLWQDDYICHICGDKKYGDYHGFGYPYQRTEFLELSYDDIAEKFEHLGLEIRNGAKQLSMFGM